MVLPEGSVNPSCFEETLDMSCRILHESSVGGGVIYEIRMGHRGTQTLFLDRLFQNMSNEAQNGNKGSILAYSLFGRFMVTGLIGALLTSYFQIPGIWAWNPKSPILRGGPRP